MAKSSESLMKKCSHIMNNQIIAGGNRISAKYPQLLDVPSFEAISFGHLYLC
jgi:hypothetical protein